MQDQWLYFIKHAGTLDYVPKNINEAQAKAFQMANEINLSEEELELQHKKKDWIYIQKSSIEFATNSGLKQGLEQGELNAKIAMTINAHQVGLPMQTISELTGFDEAAILAVLKEHT